MPFPSPGHLPNLGIEPGFPVLQADSLPSETPGKPGKSLKSVPFTADSCEAGGGPAGGIFGGGGLVGRPEGCGKEAAGGGEGAKHRRAMEEASEDWVQKDPGKTESQISKANEVNSVPAFQKDQTKSSLQQRGPSVL